MRIGVATWYLRVCDYVCVRLTSFWLRHYSAQSLHQRGQHSVALGHHAPSLGGREDPQGRESAPDHVGADVGGDEEGHAGGVDSVPRCEDLGP